MGRMDIKIFCFCLGIFVGISLSCGGGNIQDVARGNAQELTDNGWLLYENGDYNGAIDRFSRAIRVDDSYWDSFNGLGWSHFALHNLVTATSNFFIGLDLELPVEGIQELNVGSAFVYFERDDYTQTLSAAMKAIVPELYEDVNRILEHEFAQ